MKNTLFVFLFVFASNWVIAQKESNDSAAYVWFDNAIGVENSGLYIGKEYKENYKFKNGKHKFFEFNGFQKGSVVYNGQPYYNTLLKFDVFENDLLVKLPVEKGISAFSLIKDHVESFIVGDNKFIKIPVESDGENATWEYQEVLLETINFTFFKRHGADRKTIKEGRWSYVEFLKKENHSLFYQGNYYPIRNKRDVINIFPYYKEELKSVSRNYFKGIQRDENLIQLFRALNQYLLLNETDTDIE